MNKLLSKKDFLLQLLILVVVTHISFVSNAQNTVSVSGSVYELRDPPLPLPGAGITISGKKQGTSANADGKFSLANVPLNSSIVVSMVGFKSQTYIVRTAQPNLIFSLERNLSILDQVVVTGFGKQKKREIASSVSTINMNNIVDKPIVQLSQALQGGTTGISVQQTSGVVGSDQATIRIRGTATLNNADPLVIIDGIPGNMNNLDPTTVESISILKDAASASMYGSRGANGVILITTKRGKAGVVSVDYNGYYGIQQYLNVPKFVDGATFMEMRNQIRSLDALPLEYPQTSIDATRNQTDPANFPDTDWWNLVMRKNTPLQSHSLSVSGGNTAARFAINVNHTRQLGNLQELGNRPQSIYSRTTARINTTVDLAKNFFVFADVFASRADQAEPYVTGGTRNTQYLYGKVYAIPPTIAAIYPDRPGVTLPEYIPAGYRFYGNFGELWNPVANIEQAGTVRRTNDQATINLRPQWLITRNLSFNGQASYNVASGLDLFNQTDYIFFNYADNQSYGSFPNVKTATLDRRSNYFYWGGNLDYRKTIGKHNINGIVGYTQEVETTGNWNNTALISFFGKAIYSYDERYLLEAGLRRDGSSIFGAGNKWGNFPSIALGWNIDKESFFNANAITAWKVRASYGILGNNRISPYQYQNLISTSGLPVVFGNANLRWENTSILNLATDISFAPGLDFTAEWYNKETSDILIRSDQLYSAGIGMSSSNGTNIAPLFNAGIARIKGVDLSLKYQKGITKDFVLTSSIGYSKFNSKIDKLINAGVPIISGNTIIREGGALRENYGFLTTGLLQAENITDTKVLKFAGQKAGEPKFVDTDGNGMLNDNDRVPFGNTEYTDIYFGGFGFRYKSLDFDCMATGMSGKDIYFSGVLANPFQGNIGSSATPQTFQTDTWSPTNTDATLPRLSTATPRFSNYFKNNGRFVRVRYLQLGYTMPSQIASKARFKNLRVYVNAQNPFTFTKLKMLDPETAAASGELESVAPMKTFTVGLNVKF